MRSVSARLPGPDTPEGYVVFESPPISTADKVLAVLADISEVDEVRQDQDIRLYELHILDSLKTVELMIAFSDEFGVEISPAELEREQWATPRRIVADLESRLSKPA